jgi:hypothetical protein
MRLSASQVQTFIDCQRKWSWRYVMEVEEPDSAAALLGRAVHAELEKYLSGGEIDFSSETGYIAASGLQHLPKPGTPGLLIEQEFHFEGPSGHSYLGYKDLETSGIVYDHKTTSDLRWQKTADDLRTDIQATLYAVDYFRKHPDEQTVQLRWVYYQTKNSKKSAVTALTVNQTDTWNRFLEIEKIAGIMAAVSDKHPLDLLPNVNHCSAYGGCPHQGRCNLSPFDKMRSHVEQNKLLLALKNKTNGGAQAPAPGQVPSAAFAPGGAHHGVLPGVAAAAPAVAPNKLLARLQAGGAPAAAAVAPAAVSAAVAPAAAVPVAVEPAAINPPEYQPPPEPLPATVAATQQELAASLSVPVPLSEPRGRGRPAKAALPATGLAEKIKVLYINCGPVGVAVTDASHLITLAKKRMAEAGLADYRFAEYGQGPGVLTVTVVAELDALEGVLPALRLDTTTPEGSIIAVELMARAGLVVR